MKTHEPSKYSYSNVAGTPNHSYRPKRSKTIKNYQPTADNAHRPYLHIWLIVLIRRPLTTVLARRSYLFFYSYDNYIKMISLVHSLIMYHVTASMYLQTVLQIFLIPTSLYKSITTGHCTPRCTLTDGLWPWPTDHPWSRISARTDILWSRMIHCMYTRRDALRDINASGAERAVRDIIPSFTHTKI
jgi:hypothetical protein